MRRIPLPVASLVALVILLAAAGGPARAQYGMQFDPRTMEALQERALAASAVMLAEAIRHSRQEALEAGTQPIPPALRAALRPLFSDALMDQVRYRVGGGSEVSLQLNVIAYGDQAAITLEDVVVFAREADARDNLALWAHELWHVQQFRQWGLDGFAQRYVRDHFTVEAEAGRAAAELAARTARLRAGGASVPPSPAR